MDNQSDNQDGYQVTNEVGNIPSMDMLDKGMT